MVEERLIKMGEDDSTLPPEYRPTEEDIKVTRPFTLDTDSRYYVLVNEQYGPCV